VVIEQESSMSVEHTLAYVHSESLLIPVVSRSADCRLAFGVSACLAEELDTASAVELGVV
jgi:hypothetical protein